MPDVGTDDVAPATTRRPRVVFFTVITVLLLIGVSIEIMLLQSVTVWPEPGTPGPDGSNNGWITWLRFAAG